MWISIESERNYRIWVLRTNRNSSWCGTSITCHLDKGWKWIMRLFLKEHIPLILYTIGQLFIILLIYWFDGYPHILTALYAVFLGVFLLIGYLIYRYFTHISFYNRLSNPRITINELIKNSDTTPLSMVGFFTSTIKK